MREIKFFLEKFGRFVSSERALKVALQKIILRKFGVTLDAGDIHLSHLTIYLKASPILKSEVYAKQKEILEELADLFTGRLPTKII